jgi:arabinan endo-1,5-alpha-L-arabinosidase
MNVSDIQIRDPFVLPVASEQAYYLFGTTDKDCWKGRGEGFDCYRSPDLSEWDGPIPAFRPPPAFWGTKHFWAPEVHCFNDRYYMFASFKSEERRRATQILVAGRAAGPYVPLTDSPITPADRECLDGTLHVDDKGDPWIVFCHEWVQLRDGAMCAMRLSRDLAAADADPVLLFHASAAAWVREPGRPDTQGKPGLDGYVTDGPFLYRTRNGDLLMLWSSLGRHGYAMGIARSQSGTVEGPWSQNPDPLWSDDGGHGMIFRTFDNRLMMTLHQPNSTPDERAVFTEIQDTGDGLRLAR